jgi:hypothetical protein
LIMGGGSKQKSVTKVETPPPTPEQTLAQQQAAAANNLGMNQLGYTWGAPQHADVTDATRTQYLASNPAAQARLGVQDPSNPTPQQLERSYQDFLDHGQAEGATWAQSDSGPAGWQKRPLTADEQQTEDRNKQINDLIYSKLTGQVSPQDKANIDTAYGAARTVGTNNLNTNFQNALDQLNMTAGQSAAQRGLNMGDTGIAGPVSQNKKLLGENYGQQLTNFNTSLSGAQAGSMLDVGNTQQNFALALQQFQAQLAQQAIQNRQAIGDSFSNTAMGLGALNARNITQTTIGNTANQSSTGSLLGGAGGAIGGIGSLFSSSAGGTSAASGIGSMFSSFSSRKFKRNIETVDLEAVLTELEQTPVYEWTYNPSFHDSRRHIGPVTEEAPKAIVNEDQLVIPDCVGFLFAAVKALSEKVKKLENGVR